MNVFSEIIIVPPSAIDQQGHVNNLVYLQWCTEAAKNHWNKFATTTMQEDYVWVVLNHTINYKAAAFKEEKLQLTTWIQKNEGVKSERHYKIIRLNDDKIIIEAKTIWCLLRKKTLRPSKVTEEINTLFL